MGAWGEEAFENDDAADWVAELEGASDATPIHGALLVASLDYLEAPEGSIVLAAAEVVAAAAGRGGPALPEAVGAWIEANRSSIGPAEVMLALAAVDRVLADGSELVELWAETGESTWMDGVHKLRTRLTLT